MSLVGSLEDLGLGEILQIISLSGKSGILQVRGDGGEVRIVFADGMIRAAFPKDGPTDLRELLLGQEVMLSSALEEASAEARARSLCLADCLVAKALLSADVLDGLRRAHVERSVLPLFAWEAGEFSFDVRDGFHGPGQDLFVTPGVSPQMLALEGTRIRDEARRDAAAPPHEPGDDARDEAAADELALGADVSDHEDADLPAPAAASSVEAQPPQPAAASPAPSERGEPVPAVVAVDPSLAVLDWIKGALGDLFKRVHVFQRTDLGIARIRQYLARAEVPIVILALDAPPDPLSGVQGSAELVARLRAQFARLPVVMLGERAATWEAPPGARPNAIAERPAPAHLADPRSAAVRDRLAADLRSAVVRCQRGLRRDDGRSQAAPLQDLDTTQPRAGCEALGEVLPVLLRRAGEIFHRVAAFALEGEVAVGIAQSGLSRAGGPDDGALCDVRLGAREPNWFRAAVERLAPVRAAPSGEGDERLALLLGNLLAREAWVAPITAAGGVVALLYADNLPGDEPLGDSAALEQLIREAGLVLEGERTTP